MKEIQISRNDIQAGRNEFKIRRNEIQIQRNEIQIQMLQFSSMKQAFTRFYADQGPSSRGGRRPTRRSRGTQDALRSPGSPRRFAPRDDGAASLNYASGVRLEFVFGHSVFVSRSSFLLKRAKGWRRFYRPRTLGRRFRPTRRPRSLMAKKGTPASTEHPRVISPGTVDRGKRQADRSDVRQEYVRLKRARTGFEPRPSGRAPALHAASISRPLPFDVIPSVLPMRGGCGRFPSGAFRAPLIQRRRQP